MTSIQETNSRYLSMKRRRIKRKEEHKMEQMLVKEKRNILNQEEEFRAVLGLVHDTRPMEFVHGRR